MDCNFNKPDLYFYELIKKAKTNPEFTKELKNKIIENEMTFLYLELSTKKVIGYDESEYGILRRANEAQLKKFQEEKESDPDNETFQINVDKKIAEYYAKTMDIINLNSMFRDLRKKVFSASFSVDVLLCKMRICFILKDKRSLPIIVNQLTSITEKGCDWDRKNKFKSYEALYLLISKDFKKSAILFTECLATFESYELLTYEKAVLYAVFTGILTFNREDIDKKILQSSEVMEAINKFPFAYKLVESFYKCNYRTIFYEISDFAENIRNETFLSSLINYFVYEMKSRVYQQLLLSYKSLHIETMASIFGVSVEYLEKDLIKYIVDKKVSCRIDRITMSVSACKSEIDYNSYVVESSDEMLRMMRKILVSVSDSSRWLKRGNIRPRNEAVFCYIKDRNVFWGADGMCQYCGKSGKTVDHLATRFEKMLGHVYTRQHNEVVRCLHLLLQIDISLIQEILDNEYAAIRVDIKIKTDVKIRNNRPDIVILDKKKNKITLIELGLIYKCHVEIIPYVMTWDGIVTKYHKSHLKRLEIPMNVEAYIQSIVLKKTVETISFDRQRGLESGL
ncbi:subunit Rpn7 of 26S proteasome, partial [Hamiltosporidium magnivora]